MWDNAKFYLKKARTFFSNKFILSKSFLLLQLKITVKPSLHFFVILLSLFYWQSAMKIMGLPNWMHWTAWTLKEFSQWMLPSTFITILLTIQWTSHGCVLRHTNPVVLLMILSVYAFTSIMLCFLISVCFNRGKC